MDRESLQVATWRALFHGCVRESIAAAYCVARIGTQETRAWERPLSYVADDNQGNVGVVEFTEDGAVAAVSARAPRRSFDLERSILSAPSERQRSLRRLCDLPVLDEGSGVSAIFWTVGDAIKLPEAWEAAYRSGLDLFRRELLSDADWSKEGAEYYGMNVETIQLPIDIARRTKVRVPLVELAEAEVQLLIPEGSEYAGEARDLLFQDGLFSTPHA